MKTAEEWADILDAYDTRGALAYIVDEIRREQHEATCNEFMSMNPVTCYLQAPTFESTQEDN